MPRSKPGKELTATEPPLPTKSPCTNSMCTLGQQVPCSKRSQMGVAVNAIEKSYWLAVFAATYFAILHLGLLSLLQVNAFCSAPASMFWCFGTLLILGLFSGTAAPPFSWQACGGRCILQHAWCSRAASGPAAWTCHPSLTQGTS
jgi:hypothetical protein